MPVNSGSKLRQTRTAVHGWTEGSKFYTSLQPRGENAPKNEHASAIEALGEASRRGVSIVWEDPSVIS